MSAGIIGRGLLEAIVRHEGEQGMQIGIMMRTGTTLAAGVSTESNTPLRWNDLRAMATLAEDIGVDTLCAPDHLLFRNAPPGVSLPEGETRGGWEVFTLLTALAAITTRV